MNAILTGTQAALQALKSTCNCVGFAPAATYAYNAGAKTVTVTDASVFGAGDAFKRMNVEVYDESGNVKLGTIAAAAGNTGALDVSGLDLSKPLNIKVTVSSTGGCVSDGSAKGIGAAGSLGNFDRDFTSSESPNIAAPAVPDSLD